MTREEVWNIWRYHPAAVGRMVGFRDLTDELHGKWMQHILYGTTDYTLQAHRLSYKSSCLSVALAMWCVLHHGENALFMRKTDADTVVNLTNHCYFNLSGGSGLGGHLKIDALGHICFLSLPFMGLESHSVQFFNAAGTVLFSVYVGRENRQLIPAARESFFALREAVGTKDPS